MKTGWKLLLMGAVLAGCTAPRQFPRPRRALNIQIQLPDRWPTPSRAEDQAHLEAELRKALGNPAEPTTGLPADGLRLLLKSGEPDPRLDIVEFTFLSSVFGAVQGLGFVPPVGSVLGFGTGLVTGPVVHFKHEKAIRRLGYAPWVFTGELQWGEGLPSPPDQRVWMGRETRPIGGLLDEVAEARPGADLDLQRRLSLEALARACAREIQKRQESAKP